MLLRDGKFLKNHLKTRTVAVPGVLPHELRGHVESVDPNPDTAVFTGHRGGTPCRGNWRANVKGETLVAAAIISRCKPVPRPKN